MEKWEYAFGTADWRSYPEGWQADSDPGTYEDAQIALMRALAKDDPTSDYSLNSPCIVKRSDRHLVWQPVKDHAAELLAETLTEIADRFGRTPSSVIKGRDLYAAIRRVAHALTPQNNPEEFDS